MLDLWERRQILFDTTLALTARDRALEGEAYGTYRTVNLRELALQAVPAGLTDRLYARYWRRKEAAEAAWRRTWIAVCDAASAPQPPAIPVLIDYGNGEVDAITF